MSAYLSPIANEPAIDANGNPLSGGKWLTYLAGTSTPAATYTDSTGVTPLTNPIILNSRGMPTSNGVTPCTVWLAAGIAYKFILTDSNDVALSPTFDGISGINDPAFSSAQDQWVPLGVTPTYLSAASFSVPGDQTAILPLNRRLKSTNTGGIIYSTVIAVSYSAGTGATTVNAIGDGTAAFDSGLSAISYGVLSPTQSSIPANFTPFGLVRTPAASITSGGANTLTLSLAAGLMDFRSSSGTTGAVSYAPYSALSLTIPSGATMGQSNGVAARLWLAVLYTGTIAELAVINTQLGNGQIYPVSESGFITTTALSATADNAGVWYSTTARGSVPYRLVGYFENSQPAAGTWTSSPTFIQAMGPGVHKPGDVIQRVFTIPGTGGVLGTTILPADATIPQNTEGDPVFQQAITPTSALNTLAIDAMAMLSSGSAANPFMGIALFQDAAANALRGNGGTSPGANFYVQAALRHIMQAGTVAATTFKVRGGASSAGTTSLGAVYGAASGSYLDVVEIMA